jgi:hypothetical protein
MKPASPPACKMISLCPLLIGFFKAKFLSSIQSLDRVWELWM